MEDRKPWEAAVEQLYKELYPALHVYALRVLGEPALAEEAIQDVQPWPSSALRRRMRRRDRRSRHTVRRRIIQTAACLALCLLLSGGLLLAFSPEARSVFSVWVREIRGNYLEYHCASSTAGMEADQRAIYHPAWVPEGCRLTNIFDQGDEASVLYETTSGYGLVFQYFPASSGALSVYADGPSETVDIHGNPADLYLSPKEGSANGLIWGDPEAGLLMSIFADLPREDLLRIAESIQPFPGEQPPNRPLRFPEGYSELNSGISYTGIPCVNEDGEMLRYTFATAGSTDPEKARAGIAEATAGLTAEEALVNGLSAQLYRQPDGTGHLVWTNALDDLYWISGPLPAEELIEMAENVIMGP